MAKRNRKHPRGMALLLVVTVIALASALGFVMLSTATLQNRAGGNQNRLNSADYLAESGLNIAMYYLQYPDRAPALNSNGYWAGTNGDLTVSSTIPGTVNVTVTRDANDAWSYEIVCVAKSGTNADTKVTKTTGARVYVRNEYQIKHAGAFNNNMTVVPYCSITGDVWSAKQLAIKTGNPAASINGVGYCKTFLQGLGWLTPSGGFKAAPNAGWPGPSGTNDLNLYKTYTIDDASYSAETIPQSTGNLNNVVKTTSTANPAGIYFRDAKTGGAFVLQSNVVINGTLVVDGDLQIKGSGIIINAQPNFPALIVTGTLEIFQPKNSMTVNGICFVATTVKSNGTTPVLPADVSSFTVNGSLIVGTPGGLPVTTPYNVTTVLNYNATKAKAPELTSVQRVPKGVSIVRWGLP